VEVAFEPVAEQRARRLALAHAVDELERPPGAFAREVDGERARARPGVGQVARAKDSRGRRVAERRRLHVTGIVRVAPHRARHAFGRPDLLLGAAGPDVLEPSPAADVDPALHTAA